MATLPLKVRPFDVPTHVTVELPPGRRQDGVQPLPKISLDNLPDDVLAALIEEFTEAVMKAARPE